MLLAHYDAFKLCNRNRSSFANQNMWKEHFPPQMNLISIFWGVSKSIFVINIWLC